MEGGIMDKVAPSKLTLAQEDEEKKEEKVEETSTSSSSGSGAESGTTDTSNVEGIRVPLSGLSMPSDNNLKQVKYDSFGNPVLEFGNNVKSDLDFNN
jgi:hypothetical protein